VIEQLDAFPETLSPEHGLIVDLPNGCTCGGSLMTIGPGAAPHKASLRCTSCGRHCGWVSLTSWTFITEFIKQFGRPDKPIEIRRGNFQPSTDAADVASSDPELKPNPKGNVP
jgi:hypothetical protein